MERTASTSGSAWKVYLVFAVLMAVAYFVFETTSLSKLLLYNGIGLSAVIAVLVGIRRNKPANRRAWYFIAASLGSFLTADIVYYVLEITTPTVPFPSVADAFYLGMYPLMIFGLSRLVRTISPGRDVASLIDAGLVAVATFAVLGILVMDTYLTDNTMNLEGRLISLAYPVMDVALVAVAARLVAAVRVRQVSFGLMTLGLGSLMIADTIYGVLNTAGTFETGGFADAFWIGFYVLVAASALHPSMGGTVVGRDPSVGVITRSRLGVLFGVVFTVPLIDLLWGEPFDKLLTTMASMLMFALVMARLMGLVTVVQTKEQEARHDALHDSLTGLANRVLFGDRVAECVESDEGMISVLFIDLDDFKFVNDSLGHHVGDRLLVAVAERLKTCVRGADTVARLSGDEFAILLESAVDRQDAITVATRVHDAMARAVEIDDREVMVSASVGIAVDRRANIDKAETILRAADVAMYQAKSNGKARFELFEESMRLDAVERLDLTTDLQTALERGQFELMYQPIVDTASGEMRSVEALLRWNHPDRGLVMPDKFIPLAEQTGLIVPIGRWVLLEACNEVMRWRRDHANAPQGVAVNLSVRQLRDPGLLEDVADALSASGLEPQSLTLEITESILIDEADRGSRTLDQLKALRVKLAIDDFGTGYSSLSYLRRFPVDVIKVDRSFVAEITGSTTSEALVRAVVDLADSLEVATVAEGVETIEQLAKLVNLNCLLAQGYYFARPMKSAAMVDQLQTTPAAKAKAKAPAELEVVVLDGRGALDKVVAELGTLHSTLSVPLMARQRWVDAWASVHDEWEPFTVVVRERGARRIEAAALLAHRLGDRGLHEVVAMGHSSPGCTRMPSRSDRSSKLLAKGITARLDEMDRWSLHLQQVPEADPVATLLARQLPNAELVPDLWVPMVEFGPEPVINDFLSRNTRKQIRRARNRIEGDGHVASVLVASSEFEVMEVLPTIERVHVDRDHDSGRESDLDDPATLELWRRLIISHAAAGSVEISMLKIDDQVASFVVGFLDDEDYRVFDGHFATEFARYSPGRIIEAAVLERAMSDIRFKRLDWMAGVGSEKILTSNATVSRMQLVASTDAESKPATAAADAPSHPLDAEFDEAALLVAETVNR